MIHLQRCSAVLFYLINAIGFFNRFEVATVNGTNGTFYLTSDLMLPCKLEVLIAIA